MAAIVVYESLWGNTAEIARAVAEGIGPDARALRTDEATPDIAAAADLIVVGAPLLGFSLPTDGMRAGIASNPVDSAHSPDLAHPTLRAWLASLPSGPRRAAAFETRIWWSPGSAAGTALKLMTAGGATAVAKPEKFIVTGRYGPLKAGEVDRARAWGRTLAGARG